MDRVKEPFGLLVNFSDYTSMYGFDLIAFELAFQGDFLILEQLFLETKNTTITADQKRLGHTFDDNATRAKPGSLHGHTKGDTVALAHGFFCASDGHGVTKWPQNKRNTRNSSGFEEGNRVCR